MEISQEEIKDIAKKYQSKIKTTFEIPTEVQSQIKPVFSREYTQFKDDYMPKHLTWYERWCKLSEKIMRIAPDPKNVPELQRNIDVCHLDITPTGVTSFSFFVPLIVAVFGAMLGYAVPLMFGESTLFFVFFFLLAGIILVFPLGKLPFILASRWRMKASNQMILCVFYVVTYMRHTSNLEGAIEFASEHLPPPLSLDMKKIIWDVETGKYESVKESLDRYLETWRQWNTEFIEAFHLIESSLYEGTEDRRLSLLDKSLTVLLDETYEKMLHYAHNLKSPITMLHMLGVILPILGLVILPLMVNFMGGVKWYYIATLYNIILPIGVYFIGRQILSSRPSGYGDTDISENVQGLKKLKNILIKLGSIEIKINPIYLSIFIAFIFIVVGFSPLFSAGAQTEDQLLAEQPFFEGFKFLDYKYDKDGVLQGPFGLGAAIMSFFIVLGLGLSMGINYKLKSRNVVQIRDATKKLENEFASALFQLGNRLGDQLPAEMAFGRVADTMQGTVSGQFMELVSQNIKRLGMGLEQAIFDPRHGALVYFPSSLIESSMKVLVESVKKGPRVAAQAMMNISRYIKEIHSVNERLKDLMADIVASMTTQIKFLAPSIAGIVIGITSMVTTILGHLSKSLASASTEQAAEVVGAFDVGGFFGLGIPTFYFQIIVGIYVVQIVYILTILSNGIQNGEDKLSERYELGNNLIRSTFLYCAIALIVMVLFNLMALQIMQTLAT